MKAQKFLALVILLSTGMAGHVLAQNATWSGASGADWNATSSWGGTLPTSAGTATFNSAGTILVNNLVAVQSVGSIAFTSAAGTFTIGTTGGDALDLTSGGSIQILAGISANETETINAPLVLEGASGTYTFANNSSGSTLNFGGGITGGAAGATVLTLGGSNTADTNTISGVIGTGSSTSMALTVTGGVWALTGANTYAGATTVSDGTLVLNKATTTAAISSSSALVLGGGTLSDIGASSTTQTFSGTSVNAGGSVVSTSSATGHVLGLGAITRAAGGTVNFAPFSTTAAANGSFTTSQANVSGILGGYATVNGTNFAVGNGTIAGLASYNATNSTGDATTTDNDVQTAGVSLGSALTINSLTISDTGNNALALAGNNLTLTYTSATSLGGLLYAGNGSGGGSYTISSTGGVVDTNSTTGELVVNVNTGATLTIGAQVVTTGATAGLLTKGGGGTLILTSGANVYTGATTIGAGTLTIGGAGQLSGGTYNGAIANNGAFVYNSTANQTLGGAISGVGTLTQNGSGTLTLTGANTYTGVTTVNAGTLQVGNGSTGSLNNTGAQTVASGAILIFNLANNASQTTNITDNGTVETMGSNNFSLSNVALGSGTFIQDSGGTTSISSFNVPTATISTGALKITGSDIFGGNATVALGANLEFQNNTGTQGVTIVDNGTVTGLEASGKTVTLSGVISGTGGFTQNGVETILTNTDTFSGNITISSGTLQIGAGASAGKLSSLATAGTYAGTITNSAAFIFDANNSDTLSGQITGSGGTLTVSDGNLTLSNATNNYTGATSVTAGTLTLSGGGSLSGTNVSTSVSGIINENSGSVIAGATSLFTQASTGTSTLAGANTYGGATSVTAGVLDLNNNLAIQDSPLSTSATGSIVLGSGVTTPTFGGLTGSTALATQIAATGYGLVTALTLNPQSGSDSYSGVIANGASAGMSLTKTGSGTQTLSGADSYSGGTTISGGTLISGNATGLGSTSGSLAISGGGVLDLDHISQSVGAVTLGVVSTSTGSTIQSTGGTATLTTSGVTVNGTGNTIASSVTVSGNTSLSNSAALALNGTITGTIYVGTGASLTGTGLSNIASGTTIGATSSGTGASGTVAAMTLGTGAINLVRANSSTGALTINGLTTSGGGSMTFALGTTTSAFDSIAVNGALSASNTTTINIANLANGNTSLAAGTYNLISYTTLSAGALSNFAFSNSTTTETFDGDTLTLSSLSGNGSTAGDLVLTVASSSNTSTLVLPGSTLTINMRTGTSGTPNSTTITNTNASSSGNYSATSTGTNALTLSPATGTVAASGTATVNAGWTTTTTAGSRSGQVTIANTSNGSDVATPKSQTVTGGVYDFATANYTGTTLNFGTLHMGATAASQSVAFGNQTITNASYQDSLDVSATTGNSLVTATGFTSLGASTGGATTGNLTIAVSTATPGSLASTENLNLVSNDNGVTGLSNGTPTVNGGGTITTTGSVYSGQSTWAGGASGNWGTFASGFGVNWGTNQGSPGLDSGFTGMDTATFTNVSGHSTAQVNLAGATPNLNSITFNTPNPNSPSPTSYTIGGGSDTGSITLSGTSPSINVTAGTETIAAPVNLGANTSINVATVLSVPQQLTVSGTISGGYGLSNTGTGTTILSSPTGNSYTGGTTISAGTTYINNGGGSTGYLPTADPRSVTASNTSNSGTGTDAVAVSSGGTLAGSGTIAPTTSTNGNGVTINAGGTLFSGGVQTAQVGGAISTTGLTLNNAAGLSQILTLNGTSGTGNSANLTFALGTDTTSGYFSGGPAYGFASPSTNSTFLSVTGNTPGEIDFALNSTASITLLDVTSNGSLTLRQGAPYLLIAAGSDADYANLVTAQGTGVNTVYTLDGNGYVVGVATSAFVSGSTGASLASNEYTPIAITQENLSGPNSTYGAPALYLYNGDLEVVPEPGTWALMLGGLALLVFWQRRKSEQ